MKFHLTTFLGAVTMLTSVSTQADDSDKDDAPIKIVPIQPLSTDEPATTDSVIETIDSTDPTDTTDTTDPIDTTATEPAPINTNSQSTGFEIETNTDIDIAIDPEEELGLSRHLTGIEGQRAPLLGVDIWTNLPEGKTQVELTDYQDKVVVLFCFQTTCRACEIREFPVLKQLVDEFDGNDDVVFLAIQTPFENLASNSELNLKPVSEKHGLDIPFGHLAKTQSTRSINGVYKTGGTPWWIVMDRSHTVVFNDFTMAPDIAATNIRKLIAGESTE